MRYRFDVTCPIDGYDMEHVESSDAEPRRTNAHARCTHCGRDWMLRVTLAGYTPGVRKGPERLRRFPWPPLASYVKSCIGTDELKATARYLGVSPKVMYDWRHDGITETHADRVATNLGLHPVQLWSDFYADVDVDVDELVA